MTITAEDIEGVGASDNIVLGMCDDCHDGFHFDEDEYDSSPPLGLYTDISFFNFGWYETSDDDGNVCDNPEFYSDKKSFHDPNDLLTWDIGGSTDLNNETNNIEFSWSMEDLSEEYEIYIYILEIQDMI